MTLMMVMMFLVILETMEFCHALKVERTLGLGG